MCSEYSGGWKGGGGNITDTDNYDPNVPGGVLPLIVETGPLPGNGEGSDFGAILQTPFPESDAIGFDAEYADITDGEADIYALIVSPGTTTGTIGTTSELGFGPASNALPTTEFTYLPLPNSTTAPPVLGQIVLVGGVEPPVIAPNYTVSGSASVGEVETSSGEDSEDDGNIAFTGQLTVGVLTVDGVTTEFDGGGVTLSPANAITDSDGDMENWATVDQYGILEFTDGATGSFAAAVDGLQVGTGAVLVSGSGSKLITQGLELGEITAGGEDESGQGTLAIIGGGAATITTGGGYNLYLGDAAGDSGLIYVSGAGSSLSIVGTITIGNGGEGTLSLDVGAIGTITGDVTLGAQDGGQGEIDLSGQGTELSIGGALTIGGDGSGSVMVNDGALLDPPGTIILGLNPGQTDVLQIGGGTVRADNVLDGEGGNGTLIANGGLLDLTGDLILGHLEGSTGEATLSGGATLTVDNLTVGDAGKGQMSVLDGDVTLSGELVITVESGSTGMMTIGSDGDVSVPETVLVGEGGKGELAIAGGTLAIGDASLTLGAEGGSSGTMYVSGGGTLAMGAGTIIVGEGGKGQLTFQQASTLPNNNALSLPSVSIAEQLASSGNLTVTDSGTDVNIDDITVGGSGSAKLNVTAGGLLEGSGDADIADQVSANVDSASVTGQGVWKVGGDLTVGAAGIAVLTVKTGGQVFGANDVIIGDAPGSSGTVIVSGTAGPAGMIAASSLGFGTTLVVGNSGIGALSISAGGIVAPTEGGAGVVDVGAASGGAGSVVINAGTFNAVTLAVGSASASGRLSVSSGGIVALTGAAEIAAGSSAVLSKGTITAQTITIDANAVLSGYGKLTASVIDNGLISIKGGELILNGSLAGDGSVVIQSGATLDVTGADSLRRLQFKGSSGVLEIGTPGTLATIAGFAAGDSIDLTAVENGAGAHVNGNVLDITDAGGTTIAKLLLMGNYADASFAVGSDGGNGTRISLSSSQPNGGPSVTPPALEVATAQTMTVASGGTIAISSLAISDSNSGAAITANLSAVTGSLAASDGGGASISTLATGTALTITGSASQVDAALATVTYAGSVAGTDTISFNATDNFGDGDAGSTSVIVPDQAPTLTVPSAVTLGAEIETILAGITIDSSVAPGADFTITIADATGILSATATGNSDVTGAGSTALTITGDLADINSDLTSLSYTGASTGAALVAADTLAVLVDDGDGGTAAGSIEVTVEKASDTPINISLPASPSLLTGSASTINGVSITDADTAGKSFTAILSVADGALSATAEGDAVVTGAGTGVLTLSGTLIDIDDSLQSLTDTPTPPAAGITQADTLSLTVSDGFGGSSSAALPLDLIVPDAFIWSAPIGGAFNDAADWAPSGGPPGADDIAAFGGDNYTVTGNGTVGQIQITGNPDFTGTLNADGLSNGDYRAVIIDQNAAAHFGSGAGLLTDSSVVVGETSVGELVLQSGAQADLTTTAQGGEAASVYLGLDAGSDGEIAASGAATTIATDSDWVLGYEGDGFASVSGGAIVSVGTGSASGDFASTELGVAQGALGALTVDGAGSRFDDAGALIVGASGQGRLVVTNGGTVTSDAPAGDGAAIVGFAAGSSGLVMIENAGALWDSKQDAIIGYSGAGMVDIFNDGTFEVDGPLLRIGRQSGSSGSLLLTGADSALVAPDTTLNLGDAGAGELTIEEGDTASLSGLVLGAQSTGSGLLDIAGGAVDVSGGVTINTGTISDGDFGLTVGTLSAQSLEINGGVLDDDGDLTISGGVTLNGGELEYSGALGIGGGITLNGGTLGSGSGTVLSVPVSVTGGSISAPSEIGDGVVLSAAVNLGPDAALEISSNAQLDAGVTNFTAGDALEFDESMIGPVDSAVWSGGTLDLLDAGGDELLTLALPGDFASDVFTATPDGTLSLISVGPATTPAAVFDWLGGTASFTTAADWSDNGAHIVPGTADTAAFLQGGTLLGNGTVGAFEILSDVAFAGSFTSDGAFIDGSGTLGLDSGATLSETGLLITGGTATGALLIGPDGNLSVTSFIEIGQRGLGVGTISVDGSDANLSDSGALEVGEAGTGTLSVADGGSVTAEFAEVGDQYGSQGSIVVGNDGTFSLGSLIIGNYGGGALTVAAGGYVLQSSFAALANTSDTSSAYATVAGIWNIGTSLDVGYASAAELDVTAGGAVTVGSFLRLGGATNGDGAVAVSGAGASLTLNGPVYVGDAGTGTLSVADGGTLLLSNTGTSTPAITLGNQAGGLGTLSLSGTKLNVAGGGIMDGGSGGGDISLTDGATLTATSGAPEDVAALILGGDQFGQGTLDIAGVGSTFVAATGGLVVKGPESEIRISGGGALIVDDSTRGLLIDGAVTVAGTGSTLYASSINLGTTSQDGLLIITDGAAASASDATIQDASTIDLANGTLTVNDLTVFSGGILELTGGALHTDPLTIHSGGLISGDGIISGSIVNNGEIAASGGLLDLTGNISGTGSLAIGVGATLELDQSVASGMTVSFASGGSGEGLSLTDPTAFAGTIVGLLAGDSIELSVSQGVSTVLAGNVLELFESGIIEGQITFGNASGLTISQADGTITVTDDIPCFCAGTRILTADGRLVAIEDLREGDALETFDGQAASIIWLGHRSLDLRRHPRPHAVQPILITAGALGRGLPWRDLVVSPDHALYLDGILIPAKALTNGFTIRQLDREAVTYFHIELPKHAVLFAEGAGAESYLETGNRAAFDGGSALTLHPDFAQSLREQCGCAPFAESGHAVEAVRQRILDRARIETTNEPDLQIRYENGSAIVVSRTSIPGELCADPRDRRRLGVKIASLQADGHHIPLDHPALTVGWYDREPDGRWTNGSAEIPMPLLGGSRNLQVSLAATMRYPRGTREGIRPTKKARCAV